MFKSLLILSIYCVNFGLLINIGPAFPPTKGEAWPKPQNQETENNYYKVINRVDFKVKGQTCEILQNALQRFAHGIEILKKLSREQRVLIHRDDVVVIEDDAHSKGHLPAVSVELSKPCEDYPYFEMDEAYALSVSNDPVLRSDSIWGTLRGLETLSQLFYLTDDFKEIRINATRLNDYPQYPHRGLLLDTSRHYVSVKNIKNTLEAMAMNKMNVFHWHIVDDQSFPYVSEKFPEISHLGAFHPSMVYNKNDIVDIINFARDRGVRVIPEFDVPGHTRSWGEAFPNVLTKCYRRTEVVSLGPMNPLNNATYKLLRELLKEVQNLFKDKYFHIGGDEVDMGCWISNPDILEYMKTNNISSISKIHALFMEKVIPLLAKDTIPIVWQEVFDEIVHLNKKTIVQVWKDFDAELNKVVEADYDVLFSSGWYLDQLKSGGDWETFYSYDIRSMLRNASLAHKVVGGEACMWGEVVDDTNVMSRVWPRTSAVAEKLWSKSLSSMGIPPQRHSFHRGFKATKETKARIEEHTCRMRRHGISAQPPNGPGYCVH